MAIKTILVTNVEYFPLPLFGYSNVALKKTNSILIKTEPLNLYTISA